MDVERRKYIRFSVQDNIFAALGSEFDAVGKVTDISIKELTLSYICESIKTGSDRDLSQVNIFLSSSSFHLPKVPCEIVYDINATESMKNNSIMIRQCGLRFGKLSKSQSEQLESLIENYAIESQNNSLSS